MEQRWGWRDEKRLDTEEIRKIDFELGQSDAKLYLSRGDKNKRTENRSNRKIGQV